MEAQNNGRWLLDSAGQLWATPPISGRRPNDRRWTNRVGPAATRYHLGLLTNSGPFSAFEFLSLALSRFVCRVFFCLFSASSPERGGARVLVLHFRRAHWLKATSL